MHPNAQVISRVISHLPERITTVSNDFLVGKHELLCTALPSAILLGVTPYQSSPNQWETNESPILLIMVFFFNN
jgi:hypothetical protein